jgi:hypothetical protein
MITNVNNSAAAIDLQADLNRIIVAIQKFDANSAASTKISSISEARQIFVNNGSILKDIKTANAVFKKDLISAKRYLPSSDTKDSPAFSTLMNLTRGYEQWLWYQNVNQLNAQKCIKKAGNSFSSFSACSIAMLEETIENERLGRQKLQSAWDAWKQWQIKYGYA